MLDSSLWRLRRSLAHLCNWTCKATQYYRASLAASYGLKLYKPQHHDIRLERRNPPHVAQTSLYCSFSHSTPTVHAPTTYGANSTLHHKVVPLLQP